MARQRRGSADDARRSMRRDTVLAARVADLEEDLASATRSMCSLCETVARLEERVRELEAERRKEKSSRDCGGCGVRVPLRVAPTDRCWEIRTKGTVVPEAGCAGCARRACSACAERWGWRRCEACGWTLCTECFVECLECGAGGCEGWVIECTVPGCGGAPVCPDCAEEHMMAAHPAVSEF